MSRNFVNFQDNSFDFWTVNRGCVLYHEKNIKLFSDLHNWKISEYTVDYYDNFLIQKKLKVPLLVPEYNKKIKSDQIIYPYKEIIQEFGFGILNSVPALILYAWFVGYSEIYIFGSYAWGNPTKDSDLDLLVVVNNIINNRQAMLSKGHKALFGLNVSKDILLYSKDEFDQRAQNITTLSHKIKKEGKRIYARV